MKRKLWEGDKRGTFIYSRDVDLAPEMTRVKEELSWKDSTAQETSHELQESNSEPKIPKGLILEPKGCFRVVRKLRKRNISRICCFASSVFPHEMKSTGTSERYMHSIYPASLKSYTVAQGILVVEIVRKGAKGTQMFGDVRASFRRKLASPIGTHRNIKHMNSVE